MLYEFINLIAAARVLAIFAAQNYVFTKMHSDD